METETLAVFWPAVNTVHEMCYSFWPHFLEVDYCTYWKTLQEFYFLDHFVFLTKVKIVVIGAAAAKWPCPSGPAAVNGTNTRQISVQSLCKRYLQITSILLSAMSITCYKILFRHIFTIFYLKKKNSFPSDLCRAARSDVLTGTILGKTLFSLGSWVMAQADYFMATFLGRWHTVLEREMFLNRLELMNGKRDWLYHSLAKLVGNDTLGNLTISLETIPHSLLFHSSAFFQGHLGVF